MSFRERLDHYKQIRDQRLNGKYHYIPFDEYFPRMAKAMPGIIPGITYLLTANSGVGKSKLMRYLFLYIPYHFVKTHPDSGLTFRFILNALEESIEEIRDYLIITHMSVKHGIHLDINTLNGYSGTLVSDDVLSKIEDTMELFNDLDKYILIHNEGNPFGFYKRVREYARDHGTFYLSGQPVQIHDFKKDSWDHYKPNNPNEVVIVASDHVWLYDKEGDKTKYESVAHFSSQYCRRYMNLKFGYTVVNIQQLESLAEKKEYTVQGESVIDKLIPSLDKLGDIKILQRDALVVLALFDPARHRIPEFFGYDVTALNGCMRTIHILKNRRGKLGVVPVVMDGRTEIFKELPKSNDEAAMRKVYNYIRSISND